MTAQEFDILVQQRVQKVQQTLVVKGKEYRRNNDPLHNFRVAAKINNTTEEKALWGFAVKHYVSFLDILNDIERGILPKEEVVDEKIGDLINYLILCEASIKEKINNQNYGTPMMALLQEYQITL
jgi:formaldehyde-activating enzyme involved in methanogenesis